MNSPTPRHVFTTVTARRRIAGFWLVVVCGWLVTPSSVRAEASLDSVGDRGALDEAQFTHDIEIKGTVAVVRSSQVISNPNGRAKEANYTFDLPTRAAVTRLDVRLADGRTTSNAVVSARASMQAIHGPDAVDATPDVGIVRLVSRDRPDINGLSPFAVATYELRVSPIPVNRTVSVTVTWVAPLSYSDGRISFRIPERGNADNLVRERVRLTMRPPTGVRGFTSVHASGRPLGTKVKGTRFTAPSRGDITIEAGLDFGTRTSTPLVSFSHVPLMREHGVEVGAAFVSILSPTVRKGSTLDYDRILLMVDVSRSMGGDGISAATTISDALLANVPGAEIGLLTFDRAAKPAFKGFIPSGATARKLVARAIGSSTLENGSDLGGALEHARRLLQRHGANNAPLASTVGDKTLVVLLTDGMLPLALDADTVISHIGMDVLATVDLFPIVLVPDGAPTPDVMSSPLNKLANATPGGRAMSVRISNAAAWVKNLASEFNRPAPLSNVRLDVGRSRLQDITVPFTLTPGEGVIAAGVYRGPALKKITLRAEQRERHLQVAGKRDSQLANSVAPLALVQMSFADFVDVGKHVEIDERERDAGLRRLTRAAHARSTVTEHTAMVALATRDAFARDRLAMVRKWGPAIYTRLPPPAERRDDHEWRQFEERRPSTMFSQEGRRTGELDRGIIKRLLTRDVVPKARACYERSLRRDATLKGALVVVVEIARGEVQFAGVERSTFRGTAIASCVTRAAYSARVPRVALGDDRETIRVARYPLTFKPMQQGGHVESGVYQAPTVDELLKSSDPLGDMSEDDSDAP